MKQKNTTDPALEALRDLLNEYRQTAQNIASEEQYLETVNKEVNAFVLAGNLRDEKAISAIIANQMRATILPRRIEAQGNQLQALEERIAQSNHACETIINRLYIKVQCAHAEMAAKTLMSIYESLPTARHQGLRSKKAMEASKREEIFRGFNKTRPPVEIADNILKIAPALMDEVAELEKQIGEIPSLSVMVGN